MSYLNNSNLFSTHQSAYRRQHSTEKAVTKVYSDILCAADDDKPSLLIRLNLSAVFDSVDHSILLKRLESTYGFDGLTLECFKNYLSDRSFNVRCSGTNRILLTLQWVSHKDLFFDHCCFLYTLETLKE